MGLVDLRLKKLLPSGPNNTNLLVNCDEFSDCIDLGFRFEFALEDHSLVDLYCCLTVAMSQLKLCVFLENLNVIS